MKLHALPLLCFLPQCTHGYVGEENGVLLELPRAASEPAESGGDLPDSALNGVWPPTSADNEWIRLANKPDYSLPEPFIARMILLARESEQLVT